MKTRRRPPRGQHFLADGGVRRRILAALACRPSDAWLEIGAGHGELTRGLAEQSARVLAVESDPHLAAALRETLAPFPHARVIETDILKVSVAELARDVPGKRLRVYGSLPYYITSPILHHLFGALEGIEEVHVVIQREVAQRLAARPGSREYGYLSVAAQFYTAPEILFSIPRGAFRPPPEVESALVRLVPPGAAARLKVRDPQRFLAFVQLCFRHKRKTLLNNLRGAMSAAAARGALERLGWPATRRAEELSLDDFAALFRQVNLPRALQRGPSGLTSRVASLSGPSDAESLPAKKRGAGRGVI